jgi:hypothetical protein
MGNRQDTTSAPPKVENKTELGSVLVVVKEAKDLLSGDFFTRFVVC